MPSGSGSPAQREQATQDAALDRAARDRAVAAMFARGVPQAAPPLPAEAGMFAAGVRERAGLPMAEFPDIAKWAAAPAREAPDPIAPLPPP